jgi:hypothetical protein
LNLPPKTILKISPTGLENSLRGKNDGFTYFGSNDISKNVKIYLKNI